MIESAVDVESSGGGFVRIEAGCSEGSNAGGHIDICRGRVLSGSSDGGDLTLTEILLLEEWEIQFSCPVGLVFIICFEHWTQVNGVLHI